MTENVDPDKYCYFGYNVSFDLCGTFSLLDGGIGNKTIIFSASTSLSVHIDNKKRYPNSW